MSKEEEGSWSKLVSEALDEINAPLLQEEPEVKSLQPPSVPEHDLPKLPMPKVPHVSAPSHVPGAAQTGAMRQWYIPAIASRTHLFITPYSKVNPTTVQKVNNQLYFFFFFISFFFCL